jgi:hypothetical protein
MDEAREALQIGGRSFETTADGHVRVDDVRRHVVELADRVAALESENADLRRQLDHVASLQRLAEATVVKADDLAAEIQATARARADELVATCEAEIAERRRHFEADQAADLATARERVTQLQAALEGSVQTLARALQTVGAPALEMPAASAPLPPPTVFAPAAERSPHPYLASIPPLDVAAPPPPPVAVQVPSVAASQASGAGFEQTPVAAEHEEADDRVGTTSHFAPVDAPSNAMGEPATSPGGERSAQLAPPPDEPRVDADRSATRNVSRRAWDASPPPASPAEEPPRAAQPVETPVTVPADPGTVSGAVARRGPETIEIDMRPVKSFADLARVTKLLGGIAPGAQPVDLNLPQHRALFSVRGRDREALAAQLADALPEAKVVERQNGIDVLLSGADDQ